MGRGGSWRRAEPRERPHGERLLENIKGERSAPSPSEHLSPLHDALGGGGGNVFRRFSDILGHSCEAGKFVFGSLTSALSIITASLTSAPPFLNIPETWVAEKHHLRAPLAAQVSHCSVTCLPGYLCPLSDPNQLTLPTNLRTGTFSLGMIHRITPSRTIFFPPPLHVPPHSCLIHCLL